MYNVQTILAKFSHFFVRKNSNLAKLIELFSEQFEAVHETLERMKLWRDIDEAEGIVLDAIGENINQGRGYASDEVYRVLLKSKIARNLSDGTINDIIRVIREALSIDSNEIVIVESEEAATLRIEGLPIASVLESGIDTKNLARLIKRSVASGIKLEPLNFEGTFEFGDTSLATDSQKGFANIEGTQGGHLGALVADDSRELPI